MVFESGEAPEALTARTLTRAPGFAAFVRMSGEADVVRATTRPLMSTQYLVPDPEILSLAPVVVRLAALSLGLGGGATERVRRGAATGAPPPALPGPVTGVGALPGTVSRAGV